MKYLKLFEDMDKEIIDIYDFEKRIRSGEDIDIDDVLIRLPNNQIMTYMDYIEGEYHLKYYTPEPNHNKSPIDKENIPVPKGVGSNKVKKRYWENVKYDDYTKGMRKEIKDNRKNDNTI